MSSYDLIEQMVQETISNTSTQASGECHLSLLNSKKTCKLYASYNSTKLCYIISLDGNKIEIPKNWGPFKNRISTEFTISSREDEDKFFEVVSAFFNIKESALKVVISGAVNKCVLCDAA